MTREHSNPLMSSLEAPPCTLACYIVQMMLVIHEDQACVFIDKACFLLSTAMRHSQVQAMKLCNHCLGCLQRCTSLVVVCRYILVRA